jgi:hypothetical protein
MVVVGMVGVFKPGKHLCSFGSRCEERETGLNETLRALQVRESLAWSQYILFLLLLPGPIFRSENL